MIFPAAGFPHRLHRNCTAAGLQKANAAKNPQKIECGEMAERLNAAVLKTAERDERSVGSNPTLSYSKTRKRRAEPAFSYCGAVAAVLVLDTFLTGVKRDTKAVLKRRPDARAAVVHSQSFAAGERPRHSIWPSDTVGTAEEHVSALGYRDIFNLCFSRD